MVAKSKIHELRKNEVPANVLIMGSVGPMTGLDLYYEIHSMMHTLNNITQRVRYTESLDVYIHTLHVGR